MAAATHAREIVGLARQTASNCRLSPAHGIVNLCSGLEDAIADVSGQGSQGLRAVRLERLTLTEQRNLGRGRVECSSSRDTVPG